MFAIIPLTGIPFVDLIIIAAGLAFIAWAMGAGRSSDPPDAPPKP